MMRSVPSAVKSESGCVDTAYQALTRDLGDPRRALQAPSATCVSDFCLWFMDIRQARECHKIRDTRILEGAWDRRRLLVHSHLGIQLMIHKRFTTMEFATIAPNFLTHKHAMAHIQCPRFSVRLGHLRREHATQHRRPFPNTRLEVRLPGQWPIKDYCMHANHGAGGLILDLGNEGSEHIRMRQ